MQIMQMLYYQMSICVCSDIGHVTDFWSHDHATQTMTCVVKSRWLPDQISVSFKFLIQLLLEYDESMTSKQF